MLTRKVASRARTARMSAQETVPGQALSRAVLARTTASKASPARERLMGASLSALFPAVETIRTEPSHPFFAKKFIKQLASKNQSSSTREVV